MLSSWALNQPLGCDVIVIVTHLTYFSVLMHLLTTLRKVLQLQHYLPKMANNFIPYLVVVIYELASSICAVWSVTMNFKLS